MIKKLCGSCKHYQDTGLETYNSLNPDAKPTGTLYDCPYASDWCEADTEVNMLCVNMYVPKKVAQISKGKDNDQET